MELSTVRFSSDIVELFERLRASPHVSICDPRKVDDLTNDEYDLQLALRYDDEKFWKEACEAYDMSEDDLCDDIVEIVEEFLIWSKDEALMSAIRLKKHLEHEFNKIPQSDANGETIAPLMEEFVDIHWPLRGIFAKIPKPEKLWEIEWLDRECINGYVKKINILEGCGQVIEEYKAKLLEAK